MEKPYQWFRLICRSRREQLTGEDVLQDIFDLHRHRHCGTTKKVCRPFSRVPLSHFEKIQWNIFCKRSAFENCLLTIFSSHPYPPVTGDTPFVISVENRFRIIPFYRCIFRDFNRAGYAVIRHRNLMKILKGFSYHP